MWAVYLKGCVSACALVIALSSARAQGGDPPSQGVPDTFKVFADHEHAIAMLDVDQDGDLDCLTATRTEFNKDIPSATYVWQLGGLNGKEKNQVTFHFKAGPTPDQAIFTQDGTDGSEHIVKTVYTDYETCALFQFPYGGRQECMLWVTDEAKNNVPQKCVDQFRQHCDVEVVAYDENTCSQVENSH
uniref:Lipocalin n=1 Tax=Rhipicephalus appendiculatus TaxID=34631 RepID=A0A131YR96_RHIAP